ncbi:MAG: hypothetical protein EAX81_06900 [Candidatus Thorarchaeota archaeon]|nr:hypothetical protein [Candidatus Thorarchaeota archaeon]
MKWLIFLTNRIFVLFTVRYLDEKTENRPSSDIVMPIEFHPMGAKVLISHLRRVHDGSPLSEREINDILEQPDIYLWISVYDEWMKGSKSEFRDILCSLHKDSMNDLSKWGQHINQGLRNSLSRLDELEQALNHLTRYDWGLAASNTLQFLPKDTPLNAHVIMTIDGFNGGMFHDDNMFLSLTIIGPDTMSPQYFTHEFHHIGLGYWWERNPVVKKFGQEKASREAWLLRLYHYMVSEGLANAFCSPAMLSQTEHDDEQNRKHNKIIREYDSQFNEILYSLETILEQIIGHSNPEITEQYEEFSLDMKTHYLPKGHFLSGRMIQIMDESPAVSREEIIDLVREPFRFFQLYNRAARDRGHREVSRPLLDSVEGAIRSMKKNVN